MNPPATPLFTYGIPEGASVKNGADRARKSRILFPAKPVDLAAEPPDDLHFARSKLHPGKKAPDARHPVLGVLGVDETDAEAHLPDVLVHPLELPRRREPRGELSCSRGGREDLVTENHDGVGEIDGAEALRHGDVDQE